MAESRDDGVIVNYRYPPDEHAEWKAAAERKGQALKTWIRRSLNKAAAAERAEAERERRR